MAKTVKSVKASKGEATIAGRGFRKADHALVWMVTSQTESNRWHQVTQMPNGQLACDCRAAQFGRRACAHRDAVISDLAAEAASFAARQATQRDADRASAPLYRDNAPFSLFKAS